MDTPGGDDTPNLRDSSIKVLAFREKVVWIEELNQLGFIKSDLEIQVYHW
jgi:hypothetical protein